MDPEEILQERETVLQVLSNYTAHLHYFNTIRRSVPGGNEQLLPHRLLFLYFALTGCDLLGAKWITDDEEFSVDKNEIYEEMRRCYNTETGGFHPEPVHSYTTSASLTMTQCALCVLNICNLLPTAFSEWMCKEKVMDFVKSCQVKGDSYLFGEGYCGAFQAAPDITEVDLRFTYSALISLALLCAPLPLSAVTNIQSCLQEAVAFIWRCWNPHDGAFGAVPGVESHGGMTFCAVASLVLAGAMSTLTRSRHHSLLRFCTARVAGGPNDHECVGAVGLVKPLVGYQGRPQKDCDTCYTHWIGSVISILCTNTDEVHFPVDPLPIVRFINACVVPNHGGICKTFDMSADVVHSCLGLSGLLLHIGHISGSTLQLPHAVYGCSWATVRRTGLPELLSSLTTTI